MKLTRDLREARVDKPSALSIGVFDGVHVGHQYLIAKLLNSAKNGNLLGGAVTFDPHPGELLTPDREIRYLTTLEDKLEFLGGLGLDFVVSLSFTGELAQTSAREFVLSLVRRLQMRQLWIGPDFALGRDREGDTPYLRALGQELGFSVEVVKPLTHERAVISSSMIRALLRQGKVSQARHLLGRYPSLRGKVVRGAKRGHKLGFPTANLAVEQKMVIPADGIYAVRVQWGTTNHQAVVNIGVRPTFEDHPKRIVEAHILDFTGDVYGQMLQIEFIQRLRAEKRFESADALIAQMSDDVAQVRRLFRELET